MPGAHPNQESLLSTLVATARAKSVAFICLIHDDKNNGLEIDDKDNVDDDDDNDDNDNDDNFMVLEDRFGLAPPPAAAAITNNNHVAPAVPRFTRSKIPRKKQYESTLWTRYLVPEARPNLINHPNGRLNGKFHKLFHISVSVFLVLLGILKSRWDPNWRDNATCAAGKPVLHIELRLLSSIFYLTADAFHYTMSTITNISEEVHRCFL